MILFFFFLFSWVCCCSQVFLPTLCLVSCTLPLLLDATKFSSRSLEMCSSRNSPVSVSRGRLSGRSIQSEFLRALMVIMRNMILFCSHITVNLFKLGFSLHSAANGGGSWRMFTSDLFLATLNQSKQRFSVMKCLAGESFGDFAIYRPARLPWRLMPACFVCWFSCNVDRLPHARDERLRKAMAAVSVWSGVFSSSGLFSFFLFFFPP